MRRGLERLLIGITLLAFLYMVASRDNDDIEGWIATGAGWLQTIGIDVGVRADGATRGELYGDPVHRTFRICNSAGGTCVVDGDTIRIDGVPIRVADIDAPEIRNFECDEEHDIGQRAKLRMQKLVNEGPFTMRLYDRRDEDRYGRKLRVLERDGVSFGMILVKERLARAWDGGQEFWCQR